MSSNNNTFDNILTKISSLRSNPPASVISNNNNNSNNIGLRRLCLELCPTQEEAQKIRAFAEHAYKFKFVESFQGKKLINSTSMTEDQAKAILIFVLHNDGPCRIGSLITLWRSMGTSSHVDVDAAITPFCDLLDEAFAKLPTTKVCRGTCSFVGSSSSSSSSSVFTETDENGSVAIPRTVFMNCPMIFTTSTTNVPNFLGAPDQPALIYRLTSPVEAIDISLFTFSSVSSSSANLFVLPAAVKSQRYFDVLNHQTFGRTKMVVTIAKSTTNDDTNHQKSSDAVCLPSFHYPLLLSINLESVGKNLFVDNKELVLPPKSMATFALFPSFDIDSGHVTLLEKLGLLADDPNLNVPFSDVLAFGKKTTDEMLQKLTADLSESVTTATLTWNNIVTDSGVIHLVSSLTNLKVLDLLGFKEKVTDATLQAIAENLGRSIETLDLSYSKSFTRTGLNAIASSCINLSTLKLCYCEWINEAVVQGLVSSWNDTAKLITLDLEGCYSVTDAALQAIIVIPNSAISQLSRP